MRSKLLASVGPVSKRNRRARALGLAVSTAAPALIERLEGRVLFAVTSTTPVPVSVIETQAFNGSVMDFTANDAGPFSASVDWGDGSAPTAGVVAPSGGGFTVTGTHTYPEDGSYTASVAITDTADATQASNTTTGTVLESVLSAVGSNISATEGMSFTATTGSFNDPGSPDPASSFTSSIDWGDGTTTAGIVNGSGGNYFVSGTHTYADEGTFTVNSTFFENNDSGFTITVGGTATVGENPGDPLITMTGPAQQITEGGMLVYSISVQNAGTADDTNVMLTDVLPGGSSFSFAGFPQGGPFTAVGQTVSGNLGTIPAGATVTGSIVAQALEEGFLMNSVSATSDTSTPSDTDDGQAVFTTVIDAPLTPTSGKSISATEGNTFTGVVGSFSDADPNGDPADYSTVIHWGDGQTSAGTIIPNGPGFDVVGTHAYVKAGPSLPLKVSVKDIGGSTATMNGIAKVADVPLAAAGKTLNGLEGRTLSGTIATFNDVNIAAATGDFSASINWGDSHITGGTVHSSGGGKFYVTGSHTYAEASAGYSVKVNIHDIGGSNASASSIAKIAESVLDQAAGKSLQVHVNTAFTNLTLGTFRDQDSLNTSPGDYVGTINWGDGSATSAAKFVANGATFNVGSFWKAQGSHTYKSKKTFTVTITLHDNGANLIITALIKVV